MNAQAELSGDHWKNEADRLRAENALLTDNCDDASDEIDRLQADKQKLQSHLDSLTRPYPSETGIEIDRLRAESEALDRSHKDLSHKLADAGREINLLRAELEDAQRQADIDRGHQRSDKAEIDLLLAELAKRQWQDINTAPEDRQHILAFHKMNGVQRVSWRDEVEPSLYRYGGGEWIWQPTHWMPLPDPPLFTDG